MQFKKSVFSKIFYTFLLSGLLFSGTVNAQKASAESLATVLPSDLQSGEKVVDGVRQVIYDNGKLYVVNFWSGLQILDVKDYTKPREIGHFYVEDKAHNIFIENQYAYIADELVGVQIVDISNPQNPVRYTKIRVDGSAYWAVAEFPYVYVAEAARGIVVYDISDPASVKELSVFDTPGWAWSVTVKNSIAYVGDKNGGLQIIDFTNKTAPKRLGQFTNLKFAKTIFIDDNKAFIANGPDGLAIVDIANPAFPKLISTYNTKGFIFDVYKTGKNIFLATEQKMEVEILNVADISKPEYQGSYKAQGKVYGVWKEDVYVFVAADKNLAILRYNNQPLLADIPPQTIPENQQLTITPVATEPDGDPVYFEADNLPKGAQIDSLSGVITWTPDFEQSGDYPNVTIRVIENTATKLSDSRSFTISVAHVNRLPSMAAVDDYTVAENNLLTFDVGEGTDPDKQDKGNLTYSAENLPEGAVFDNILRKFSWTPGFDQSGLYTVDFVVNDGAGGTARDASTITVTHADRRPVIVQLEDQSINENELLTLKIEGEDKDNEDQNAISFAAENLPEGAVFDATTREFNWTPTYDQSGEYENILFILTAGNLKDSTAINISVNHVNRAPMLTAIPGKSVDEQKQLSFSLTAADNDVEDTGKLVLTATGLPQGAEFKADSGKFVWTPTYEQSGKFENLTFTVTDPSGLTDSKTVVVQVNHVNRPPLLNELQAVVNDENMPVEFAVTGSDPDTEDQDKLTYTAANLPEGAVFENNIFKWTPTYDQSGEYTVSFTLSDGQISDTKSVMITVNHVNRVPEVDIIEPKSVAENAELKFTVTASDPDTEDNGQWVLSASGLPEGAVYDAVTSTFTWTPGYEQSGEYEVTFTNTDPAGLTASQTAKITVTHVNRTPVFAAIAPQTIDENTVLAFEIMAGTDPDVEDQQKITYTAEGLPQGATFDAETRMFNWMPGFDQSGNYKVTVVCSDGEFTVPQSFDITVNHINREPFIEALTAQNVNENTALNVKLTAGDPDKEDEGKWTLTATGLPQGANFNASAGELIWTPTYEQSGTYSITFTNTDPVGLSVSKELAVTVNHVNRSPELTAIAPQATDENTPLTFTIPAGTDPDQEDQGKLTYSAQNMPSGANFDASSLTFNWTPGFDQAGNYQVKFICSDGQLQQEQSVNITVANINRPPVLEAVDSKSVKENQSLTFSLNANDPDQEELTFSAANLPSGANLASDGSFSWTPGFEQAGEYTVNVTAEDAEGSRSEQSFSITVENTNRKPQISGGGSVTVQSGETATLNFSAEDPDGDSVELSASGLPGGANFDAGSGTVTWQTGADQSGTYNFTVTASDGTDSVETSGTIIVNLPPPPPQQE